ncbi:MAG: 2Fe-2S iron-sulfur cluster-binding protein, partial [Rubrivivax sp.]|nr:2Fe-2S iron-sulfur cluster-binding protein [Rubrivivax sp.]
MADTPRTIEIEVLRYRPEQEAEPVWQRYTVPYTDDMSVLQALQHIKDEIDGSLSFRWSCRMAICGSCGMMVDGKPKLSCQTFLRDLLPGPVRV